MKRFTHIVSRFDSLSECFNFVSDIARGNSISKVVIDYSELIDSYFVDIYYL